MFLKDYISGLDKKYRKVFFSGISFESSRVKKDNIFFLQLKEIDLMEMTTSMKLFQGEQVLLFLRDRY